MADVVIYTRPGCGYCMRALDLLDRKGVDYEQHDAGADPNARQEMMDRSGRTTFPQIFIGEQHIGGCDDMVALDRDGKLDDLLGA